MNSPADEMRELVLEIIDVMDSLAFLDLPEQRPMRFALIDVAAKKLLALTERVAVVRPTSTQAEVVEHVRELAKGCCGDDSWRGRFCQYHAGYRDGFDDAVDPGVAVSDSQETPE